MPGPLRIFALGFFSLLLCTFAVACSDDDTDSISGTAGAGINSARTPISGALTPTSNTPSASLQGAEAEFCNDLDALGLALSQLNSVNSSTTVTQLQTIRTNIQTAMDTVQESAANLRGARLNELQTAHEEFEASVDEISGSTTVGQAAETIQDDASDVVEAQENLGDDANCP